MCKKVKGTWAVFVAFVLFTCAFINNVHAEEVFYVNDKSVQMTEEEYNNLLEVFSELKIATISQEEFDKYANGNVVSQGAVYQKTTTVNGVVTVEEVSKEEYENADEETNSCNNNARSDDSSYFETTYKKLNVTLFDAGSVFDLVCSLSWKKIPTVRSYDVFAFLLSHFNYSNVTGSQVYKIGSSATQIDYNTSSEGYKSFSNGAGMSMNLKDGTNITGYEMTLYATLTINSYNYSTAHAWVSYQHAQTDLTRAQSKNYYLSIGGLGNVIQFNTTTLEDSYDGMSGVQVDTPIA